jgi:amidase
MPGPAGRATVVGMSTATEETNSIRVIGPEHAATSFDASLDPVLEIESGDLISFETDDSTIRRLAEGESMKSIGHENMNLVYGPVAVRGAEPGDAVRIEVASIEISRAWSLWMPGFGPLGGRADGLQVLRTPVEEDRLRIGEHLTVPLAPMIGCIGLAPAVGVGSTMSPTYPTGGNMDLRELMPGATLWLPVEAPGGLLSVGDLHAAMGQAEPTYVALEAAGTATLRVDLEKGAAPPSPRIRLDHETICVGMSDTPRHEPGGIAAATTSAMEQAYELLTTHHGLSPMEAYAYASARVGLRFGGPAGSLVLAVVPDP